MELIFAHKASLALMRARRSRPAPGHLGQRVAGALDARDFTHAHSLSLDNERLSRLLAPLGVSAMDLVRKIGPLHILQLDGTERVNSRLLRSIKSLPPATAGPPVRLCRGVFCTSPAGTMTQLAPALGLPELMLVASELMGRFSLDAIDPGTGPTAFNVEPLASKDELVSRLAAMPRTKARDHALCAAALASPNAWSPRESVLATMLSLPAKEGGYGLGPLALNQDVKVEAGSRARRIPDIQISDLRAGLNYDGALHLETNRLIHAGVDLGAQPGSSQLQELVERLRQELREKYVDDRRRDRELGAAGIPTLVATKEDLWNTDALDNLVGQVLSLAERQGNADVSRHRQIIADERYRSTRAEVLARLTSMPA